MCAEESQKFESDEELARSYGAISSGYRAGESGMSDEEIQDAAEKIEDPDARADYFNGVKSGREARAKY